LSFSLVDRDIVLASHLKPLDKSDSIGQCFKQTWNVNTSNADDTTRSQNQHIEVLFPNNITVLYELYTI